MSTAEIFILVLMGVVALQMYLLYRIIQDSLETMRRCSGTSDKACALAMRALDGLVDVAEASTVPPADRGCGS